mmetsp:Transcript_4417/g.5902  ORF Transcript_4417/g.5902 Transcript_4417/m.5902 type:complete len:126 (-) Transcript_4417:50-427(-)
MIFVHDEEQRAIAQAAMEAFEKESGRKPATLIRDAGDFYIAEFYHCHYNLLSRFPDVTNALLAHESAPALDKISVDDFCDSPIVTKFNGYAGGNGSKGDFEADLVRFELDKNPELSATLRAVCRK